MTKALLLILGTSLYLNAGAQTGYITTVAGTGVHGYTGDGGAAKAARLGTPVTIAFDASGNMYFSDIETTVIRKISPAGIISTVAGNGTRDYTGDGGAATNATLLSPSGIALDNAGNLYIADEDANVVRMVNTSGIISTFAGEGSHAGGTGTYSGDGGQATDAGLSKPKAVAADAAGNVYIADSYNSVLRKVNAAGVISTIAGINLAPGYSGDGGPANMAKLGDVTSLAISPSGELYMADQQYISTTTTTMSFTAIRKIDAGGSIYTVAGSDTAYVTSDEVPAIQTRISAYGIAFDHSGTIYLSDRNVVRKIDAAGVIHRVAGVYSTSFSGAFGGDYGYATSANLNNPLGVAVNATGDLYIADAYNSRIRRVTSYNPILVGMLPTGKELAICPNPNDGDFAIKGIVDAANGTTVQLQVADISGRIVYSDMTIVHDGGVDARVSIGPKINSGVYILSMSWDAGSAISRVLINK